MIYLQLISPNILRKLLSLIAFLASFSLAPAQTQDFPVVVRPLYRTDTLTIAIVGDIMMHERQIHTAARPDGSYDFSSYFKHIKNHISSADIAVGNMEFTLAGKPYSGYPTFSAPDSYAEYMAECGFDIFLAANNHIFDKRGQGAKRTIAIYKELQKRYGIMICGLADDPEELKKTMPLKVTKKGIRTAFVNFTYGTNLGTDIHWPKTNYMSNTSLIESALKEASDCDVTIVLPHWGIEYDLKHSPEQESLSISLAEKGADVIIGGHPHVPQDFGKVSDRMVPVAYSLGNIVSNMSHPNTQVGLMANLKIVRRPQGDVELLPITFTYLWCSLPGGYTDSYTVLPIKEFIDRKSEWKNVADYEKMISSYERVRMKTGIEDN